MAHYGFIGIGIMGGAMAANLLAAGHELTVYNRDASKCAPLVASGASQVSTPLEVVAAAQITFCMVSDPDAALAVCFSPHGVIQAVGPGKSYVDMTTIDPVTAEKIAISVQARGGQYLEAPVSGSLPQARAGELVIMAAGDEALWQAVQPAFAVMGKKSVYLGEVGRAAAMKLALNMIMGTMTAALGEGLALLEKCAIDKGEFIEVLAAGALASPLFSAKGAAMAAGDFSVKFPLEHQQKDLRLALQLGDSHHQPLPVAASANEQYKRALAAGLGREDMCAVAKVK